MKYVVKALKTSLKSPLTAAATSVVLRKLQDTKGNNIDLADFGDWFVLVVKQGDTIEMIKCDAISTNPTTNAATCAVATNGRAIDCTTPYAGYSTGEDFQSGAEVIITNDPLSMSQFANVNIANTWALAQTFTVAPVSSADAVSASELVRLSQLQSAVLGVLSSTPVVIPGNGGETLTEDQLVYLKISDGEWYKCDADTAATVDNITLGMTRGAGSDGVAITNGITILGEHEMTGLTANQVYYAGNTAGAIATSAGTTEVTIGFARSTTKLWFMPRFNQQITEDQQDALAGTSGTPSNSNKFVTNDDTASAATANKIARRNSTGDVTVPTTPTASTDAASKAYIDSKAASLIAASITSVISSVANTSLNTMITVPIPANTLSTDRVIRMRMYGQWINGANAQTLTVSAYYGSTAAFSITFTSLADGSKQANFVWEVLIYANAATNAQKGRGEFRANQVLQTYTVAGNPNVLHWQDVSRTLAEDSTTALDLTIKTQLGGTANAPTITIDNYTVEVLKP